ncbi:lysophosphatidic acid receptor 6-like [Sphaeramia orbicularis]|uniref:lysophosphatidic acid receptor 6-like n=1 Tax=Sphaeramia orbicularis TaxID=375764 RepID=UPI00117FA630|nr:lysophosphatidic acid receptor 6-like [Sphaeramia orbicularis]
MNNTVEDSPEPQLAYAVIFGCIMVLGLPLNAVSLWILLRRHSLKSPNVVFMINLAVSDLLLIIALPLRIYSHATGTWTFNPVVCKIANLLLYMNIRTSSIFITFLSVDRLLAVVYPLRSRRVRTASNAMKAAALAWLTVLLINITAVVNLSRDSNKYTESFCFIRGPDKQDLPLIELIPHIAIFQLVLLVTLLTVNVVSTFLVSWTLHKHLSDCVRVNNKVNVLLLYVMNLMIFTVCFLPWTVGLFISGLHTYLLCLATANCCLDPLLYYFSLDAFWKKKEDVNLGQEL